MFGLIEILALVRRYWYIIPIIGLGTYIAWLKIDNSLLENRNTDLKSKLSSVIQANKENSATIDLLRRNIEAEHKIIEKELKKADQANKDLTKIKKELRNVKGAEERVSPYRDNLADRLRQLDGLSPDSN